MTAPRAVYLLISFTSAAVLLTVTGCASNDSAKADPKPRPRFVRSGSSGDYRAVKSTGNVVVEVTLDEQGQVKKALIVESSGDAKLNEIALLSVRNQRFAVSEESPTTVRRVIFNANPDGGSPIPMQADWGF